MTKLLCLFSCFLLLLASGLSLADPASISLGKALFNDPALSGSPTKKSCNTCHQDGSGVEFSGDRPDLELQINRCIQVALKGKKLELNSTEMQSMKKYLISLGD